MENRLLFILILPELLNQVIFRSLFFNAVSCSESACKRVNLTPRESVWTLTDNLYRRWRLETRPVQVSPKARDSRGPTVTGRCRRETPAKDAAPSTLNPPR